MSGIVLQFDFFGILSNVNAFMVLLILTGAGVGMFSRKLSIAGFGAILTYGHVTLETSLFIFDAILYLVLFVLALWLSQFVVSEYFSESTGGE